MATVFCRSRGSAGGHRGLLSIINEIETEEFARLRVGVGRPEEETEPSLAGRRVIVDHVLRPFTKEEEALMEPVRVRVTEALECVLSEGLDRAMGRYNQAE